MATIKKEEYPIKDNGFEYLGKHYDCHYAIERDMKMIIQEAETSHKNNFDEFYDRDTLKPDKVKLFLDEDKLPIFGMVLYKLHQKKDDYWRIACGGYYPFVFEDSMLFPHPYQESICW